MRGNFIFLPTLSLLAFALSGISECAPLDADADGWTTGEGDCNDQAPEIHPDATEVCDLVDNDCDQAVDEGYFSLFFRDKDADGFGDTYTASCTASPGYVAARGDCADNDALSHPGAKDPQGDGLDQDCGGTDGPQPHFGFTGSTLSSLQAALDLALPGDVVWVGPGTWPVLELSPHGKNLTLISTHLAEKTVLDAQKMGRVMRFTQGENASTLVDGFTITGGYLEDANGAGILISDASPTLTGLVIRDNKTVALDPLLFPDQGMGGGIALEDSFSTLEQLRVESNHSIQAKKKYCAPDCQYLITGGFGGGIHIWRGSPTLQHLDMRYNRALPIPDAQTDDDCHTRGGGLRILEGTATISNSVFWGNESYSGGGIYVESGELTLTDSRLEANQGQTVVEVGAGGGLKGLYSTISLARVSVLNNILYTPGGISIGASDLNLQDVTIVGNDVGMGSGGGIAISGFGSKPLVLSRVLIANNRGRNGGGLLIGYTEAHLSHVTVAGNIGRNAGGLSMDSCYLTVEDSLFAHNIGPNAYNFPPFPCEATFSTTSIYSDSSVNQNLVNQNLTETGIAKTWLEVDPRFVSLSNDLNPENDDFHLRPDSPLRDAGTAGTVDDDGSPAELGYYGGTGAYATYYTDNDADGLYDGWEMRFWANTSSFTSAEDADGDGLTNAEELLLTTNPATADSDGDGVADGLEITAGASPLDWYRRPPGSPGAEADGTVIGHYPGDFPTLQAAVNAIGASAEIRLAPGNYAEHVLIAGKDLYLHSTGTRSNTIWTSSTRASLLTGLWTTLTLEHVSLSGGDSYFGGGIDLYGADAVVRDVTLEHNIALVGGGIYTEAGNTLLENMDIRWNRSEDRGGGLNSKGPELLMRDVTLTGNESWLSFGGGASIGDHLTARLENVRVIGNFAYYGGGGLTLEAGANLGESAVELVNVVVAENTALGTGGGICASSAVAGFNVLIRDNVAKYGGAYYLSAYTSTFTHLTAVGNWAEAGTSGLSITGTPLETLILIDSVVAYNEGLNLYVSDYDHITPTVDLKSTVLYNPSTDPQHNLTRPDPGLWTFEPGFLRYDTAGLPVDLHLAQSSRGINAGTSLELDADGSAPDLGMYGGPPGALWDRDADGAPAYFWPGEWGNAPSGVNANTYDLDDEDPLTQ